ncbi:BRO family protein [Dictyobacter formicarum]|uniref:Phage antirepressor n=1 Tax=Dictyobacter formicarum TaxID=2778368 RepID=A0ABQ3VNK8_9CHLR|nr:BRO family protein [Dictyobacter formicarum]GHO87640.1 phage antirepressor [Dictyobacter formicarum]
MADGNLPQSLSPFHPDVRRLWHRGEWYYAIVDIIAFLTESKDPGAYWRNTKKRLADDEGAQQTLDQLVQLKLKAQDGRFRLTDTANRQSILRLMQSIPSPRAEPLRLWLAQVGEERFEEIEHPEQALERVKLTYRAKGYDDTWIEERIKNDLLRNELTDEWKARGAHEGVEFAVLTNEIHQGTFAISVQAHKKYKLLPIKTNLRDHMTPLELALTSLSEATAITLHQDRESQGFPELRRDARDAGEAGGEARQVIEKRIGKPVLSSHNFLEKARQRQRHVEPPQQPSLFDEPSNDHS